ncbi:MAG: type II secretion system GspH family protein [Phycisphaeraceae bacterium]|nr:type II secretion system GspH family protein [Phycisphaeraceae bacterium]
MNRSRAFTLIELLVVMSIIALLTAILLPALSKARLSTQRTRCLINQKSTVVATMSYAAESKGFFPWSVDPDTGHTPDMRKRGFKSLYNAHGGYNFVSADGSGTHFLDQDYMVDEFAKMSGAAGNVDGRRSGTNPITGVRENNAEALYKYVADNG